MIHIHAPQATLRSIHTATCLDCGRRSRFACLSTPWYGWRSTCLLCGRTWCESEWMPLPFERQARQRSISSAKRSYRRAIPSSEYLRLSPSEASAGNPATDEQNPPRNLEREG